MSKFLKGLLYFVLLVLIPSLTFAFEYKKVAAQRWVSYKTENFNLVTDLEREKAIYLLRDLESFRYLLSGLVGIKVSGELPPLPILAISDYKVFQYLGLPGSIGGLFQYGQVGYSALAQVVNYSPDYESSNLARHVLLHEYFHFLTFFSDYEKLSLPGWYIEGMAEYWATYRKEGNEILIGDPQVISDRIFDLYASNRGHKIIDSQSLMQQRIPDLKDISPKGKLELDRFYARSFFLAHYLNSSPELRESTAQLIKQTNSGMAFDEAVRKSFGLTFGQLDKKINDYLVDGKLVVRKFIIQDASVKFPEPEVEVTRLSKAERYHFIASIFWDSKLIDADYQQRESMLKLALKKNKDDAVLQAYLRALSEVEKN